MTSDNWTTIGAIAEVFDGPHATPKKIDEGPVFLGIASLNNGSLDLSKSEHLSEEDFAKWTKRVTPKAGDVVFSYETRLGDAAIIPEGLRCCLGRRMGLLRPNLNKVLPEYLLYAYLAPDFQSLIIARTIHGSTVDRIALKDLPNFPIQIPPLEEQRSTIDILKSLDDKIELNRQINQTLEQIAQTNFKSWFVDFEPVKAKIEAKAAGRDPERAAMCAISGKLEPELDQLPPEQYQQLAATAALFPDELVDSELGLIPVGWEVKSVSDVSKFATGKIDVSTLSVDNYISTENMLENKGGVGFASSLPSVPKVPNFSRGQVLISNIRPYFKKIWLARFDGGRSNDVLCFESFEEDCIEFLYNLFYQDEFFDFMMRTSKGAKMPRGDKNAIAGWKFACARHALRSCFSEKVQPYYSYIESLNAEVQQLSYTRDALLPKLLSGELSLATENSFRMGQVQVI
ncbi:restriction endonuclease subunit S [uncultured Desulfuromonas sp.]|uniref:restriction endonuclease subunit S n=1 Tax=uncultured Desulfuromonas sp. TaxID=181013 RepID=UPI002AAB6843|nr:restriction endonuclease subunit S [uncultured Desulfuromonas sp.]